MTVGNSISLHRTAHGASSYYHLVNML